MSEVKKIKVALMSYSMDNRSAKGTALYTRKLIEHLLDDKRFDFHLVHYHKVDDPIYQRAKEILMPRIKLPYGSQFLSQLLFYWKYRNNKFDLIHWFQPRLYPFYFSAPTRKIIVTVHGAGQISFEQPFFDFSKWIFNIVMSRFNYWVDAAIADSESAKKEIIKYYHFDDKKVSTIYLGGGEDFFVQDKDTSKNRIVNRYGINGPFILCVSRLQPHKNINSLLKAYEILRLKYERTEKLVIVGRADYDSAETHRLAKESNYRSDIYFLDFVDSGDLNAFYSAATIFVFPSVIEGFGLPVLESMASGTAVVASGNSSMPEIAGTAGLYFDPKNLDDMVTVLNKVLADHILRRRMEREGLLRVQNFSWEKTARETSDLYLLTNNHA